MSSTDRGGESTASSASAPKRVLFLAPYLGDGGTNTHMLTLGRELQERGWQVAICSSGPFVDRRQPVADPRIAQTTGIPRQEDYADAGIADFRARVPLRPHRLRDLPEVLRFPIAAWHIVDIARR